VDHELVEELQEAGLVERLISISVSVQLNLRNNVIACTSFVLLDKLSRRLEYFHGNTNLHETLDDSHHD
jgi:hypothetical protein